MKRRIFSLFLVFALCLSLLPGAVWAEDTPVAEPAETNEETTEPEVLEETDGEEVEVGEVAYAAKIGDETYATLQEAINAAKKDDTIEVLQNVDLGTEKLSTYDVKASVTGVTIDLGGYTVSGAGDYLMYLRVNDWTIQNGTLSYTNASSAYGALAVISSYNSTTLKNLTINSAAVGVHYSIASNANGIVASVTVGEGTKISGTYGVRMKGQLKPRGVTRDGQEILNVNGGEITGSIAGVAVYGAAVGNTKAGVIVNVAGGKVSSDTGYAIAGNGSPILEKTTINISGGEVVSTKDTAIYHPQAGVVNVTGGEITGVTGGIQMCAGTLNVSGGTITATGSGDTDGKTGDGSIPDGAAVSIVDRSYPAGTPTADITGGTMQSAAGVMPVQAYGWASSAKTEWTHETGFITGGTFSADVSAYAPAGVNLTENEDGTYGATDNREAAIGDVKYATLEEAIENAKDGDTVKLLKDATTESAVNINASITLDLGEYTIERTGTGKEARAIFVNDGADVTIKAGENGGVTAATIVLEVHGGGKLTVEGGTYTGAYAVAAFSSATKATNTTLSGGVFNGWVYTNGTGHDDHITINGGTYNKQLYLAAGDKSTYEINGGTFLSDESPIEIDAGALNINGGVFRANVDTSVNANHPETNNNGSGAYKGIIVICKPTGTSSGGYIGDVVVNINGGTFENTFANGETIVVADFGKEQADVGDAKVTISNATVKGDVKLYASDDNTDAELAISGGTFSSDVSDYLAAGCAIIGGTDGYTVATEAEVEAEAVAKIGEKSYSSLKAALTYAVDGDTVTLVQDAYVSGVDTEAARTTVISKITLELDGYTIFSPDDMGNNDTNFVALIIDADTTINDRTGGGGIDTGTNGGYALNVRKGATLTINGGRYYGGGTAVQVQKGTLVINDGEFACEPYSNPVYGYKYLINCIDAAWKAEEAKVDIRGGSFENFDPSDSASENPHGNFVNENYGAYTDSVSAGTDKVWRVGVKQAVSSEEITGKDETEQTVINTALESIKDNKAANNFAGHGADEVEVSDDVQTKLEGQLPEGTDINETTIITTISVTTTAMDVNNGAVTAVTFEVQPIAKVTVGDTTYTAPISNTELNGQTLTFRLPIPFNNAKTVTVYHGSKEFGTYNVLGSDETGYYVELSSSSFSTWTVQDSTGFEDEDIVATTTKGQFESLAEALNAAENGDTVTVLRDCELDSTFVLKDGRTIKLDLNNCTVTSNAAAIQIWHGDLTIANGTFLANSNSESPYSAIEVYGAGSDKGANYSVLTVDNVTITTSGANYWYTASIVNLSYIKHAYGAVINVKNGSRLTSKASLAVNGSIQDKTGNYPKVNIDGSYITGTEDIAIYGAGYADWTITNSTVTGATGIYAKAGNVTVTGSTITGNGNYAKPKPNGNGGDPTGDAIVLDSKKGYAGNMTLTLKDSTVTSINGSAVHEALTDMEATSTQTVTIEGGSFSAAADKETIKTSEAFDRSDNTKLEVIGTPTGVPEQKEIGHFTAFNLNYADGVDYSEGAFKKNFLNSDSGNAGTVNYATRKAGQELVATFEVTMGTVSYSVDGGENFTTITSGKALAGYDNDKQIIFQIECGRTVTKKFTVTPHWESISKDYTLTVKAPTDVNLAKDGTYTFDVVVSSTDTDPKAVGSYDFTLTYPTEYFTFDGYSVKGAEIKNDAENGSVKIGAALENGITPTAEGVILGAVTLKAKTDHVDGKDEIKIEVTNPVVTPKGYDNNKGEITPVAHEQYYINFEYVGCAEPENYNQWFTAGTVMTAKDPIPKTGWSKGSWDNDFESGVTTATEPKTYTYTAHHDVYKVTWDNETNPMSVTKTDENGVTTNLTNGGEMHYEDSLTVTVSGLAERNVIRNGDFKYTIGETVSSKDRNGETGYEYTIGPNAVNGDVTLSYTTTEYVEIKFDGAGLANLQVSKDDTTAVTVLTAYTLKAKKQGNADKLYASVDDFIKGTEGTAFEIPFQVATEGSRLVPPAANGNKDKQQWKIGDTNDTVTNTALTVEPYTQSFFDDTTLTPDAVKIHKVTFAAGNNGNIKDGEKTVWYVDNDTPVKDILDGNAKDYSTGDAEGTLITLPDTTPNNGYKFKDWTESTGAETVTGNITITANFEQAWYDLILTGFAQMKNVTGKNDDGQVSWSKAVTFKLNAKTGTRITKVTYKVEANANGTAFDGVSEKEIEAVNGVYTIPASDIMGDVTVAVTTEDTVTITIEAGTNANGTVGGQTLFVVKKGTGLPTDMNALTLTPNAGYKWDGKFYTDPACETELESDATFDTDTILYVKFVDATYSFDKDEGVTVKSGLTDDGKAKHGDDIKFTVDSGKTGLISKVGYTVGESTAERELKPDADGNYTIPGDQITGDIKVTVTTLAKEAGLDGAKLTVSFILRDSTQTGVEGEGGYMANVAQNANMKIMLLRDEKNTKIEGKFFRLDNGTQMYWSGKYEAYVCWVPANTTAAGMNGRISFVAGETPLAIKYDGDLNFDGTVNSADAGIVNDALFGARAVPTSALQLFEMDVTGNKTIDANDVTWILKKTVGLSTDETTGN